MVIEISAVGGTLDIKEKEWASLHSLLKTSRSFIDKHAPDGYSLGWNINPVGGQNVEHAHLHLIGRFEDEPLAGKGIRYAFKQPDNKRP